MARLGCVLCESMLALVSRGPRVADMELQWKDGAAVEIQRCGLSVNYSNIKDIKNGADRLLSL